MERIASTMSLYPNKQIEYKQRHDELWPEMKQVLKEHSVNNYSIFLDEERDILFSYLEVESLELYNKISETEICQKWWAYMVPIMKTNKDNSPENTKLKNVFYLS